MAKKRPKRKADSRYSRNSELTAIPCAFRLWWKDYRRLQRMPAGQRSEFVRRAINEALNEQEFET